MSGGLVSLGAIGTSQIVLTPEIVTTRWPGYENDLNTNLTNLSNAMECVNFFHHELHECRRSGHPSLHSYNSLRFV